jgi:hypothetical protein
MGYDNGGNVRVEIGVEDRFSIVHPKNLAIVRVFPGNKNTFSILFLRIDNLVFCFL